MRVAAVTAILIAACGSPALLAQDTPVEVPVPSAAGGGGSAQEATKPAAKPQELPQVAPPKQVKTVAPATDEAVAKPVAPPPGATTATPPSTAQAVQPSGGTQVSPPPGTTKVAPVPGTPTVPPKDLPQGEPGSARQYPAGTFSRPWGARFHREKFLSPKYGEFWAARIVSIPVEGSPLHKLKLTRGDVITNLDRAPVYELQELEIHAYDTLVYYMKEGVISLKQGRLWIDPDKYFTDPAAKPVPGQPQPGPAIPGAPGTPVRPGTPVPGVQPGTPNPAPGQPAPSGARPNPGTGLLP